MRVYNDAVSEFVEIYGEAGMVGVAACLLVFLVISLSRKADRQQQALERVQLDLVRQTTAVQNAEQIVIKLIDRWDASDETRARRHEELVATIAALGNSVTYLRGRINGHDSQ